MVMVMIIIAMIVKVNFDNVDGGFADDYLPNYNFDDDRFIHLFILTCIYFSFSIFSP